MKIAPTRLPSTRASTASQSGSPYTVVASAPLTTLSSVMLPPNQSVNRSRALPYRCVAGTGAIVLSSMSAGT